MDVGEGRRRTSGAKGNGPLDVTSREECFVYSSTKWSAELRLAAEIQPEREKEALLGGAQEEMHLRWSPQPLLLPCWMATSERCNHCESLCCFSPVPFCFWRTPAGDYVAVVFDSFCLRVMQRKLELLAVLPSAHSELCTV